MTSDTRLLVFQLNQAANECMDDKMARLLRKAAMEITEVWARLEVQRSAKGKGR